MNIAHWGESCSGIAIATAEILRETVPKVYQDFSWEDTTPEYRIFFTFQATFHWSYCIEAD